MQVRGFAVEGDGDLVAAAVETLVVQRLVDVADEVDEEFERVGHGGGVEGFVLHAGGLVGGVVSLGAGLLSRRKDETGTGSLT